MSIWNALNGTMAGDRLGLLLQQYMGQGGGPQMPQFGSGPTTNWYANYRQPTAVDLARPAPIAPPGPAAPALTPAQQMRYMTWEREGGIRPNFTAGGAGDGTPGPGASFGDAASKDGGGDRSKGSGGGLGFGGLGFGGFGGGGGFGGLGIGGGLF